MTQLELVQWLVQLSGDSLDANATTQDFMAWAANQGLAPAGGWSADAALTRDVLAQILVQFFNFKVKKGSDPLITLRREGIILSGTSGSSEIVRSDFVSMVDKFGFQPRTAYALGTDKLSPSTNLPHENTGNVPRGNGWGYNGNAPGQGNGIGWGHNKN